MKFLKPFTMASNSYRCFELWNRRNQSNFFLLKNIIYKGSIQKFLHYTCDLTSINAHCNGTMCTDIAHYMGLKILHALKCSCQGRDSILWRSDQHQRSITTRPQWGGGGAGTFIAGASCANHYFLPTHEGKTKAIWWNIHVMHCQLWYCFWTVCCIVLLCQQAQLISNKRPSLPVIQARMNLKLQAVQTERLDVHTIIVDCTAYWQETDTEEQWNNSKAASHTVPCITGNA